VGGGWGQSERQRPFRVVRGGAYISGKILKSRVPVCDFNYIWGEILLNSEDYKIH
jgi:hypothetical protein